MDAAPARQLWHRLEAINAVAYFSPECTQAPARAGLIGFWMGYFACRAAPMGAVPPGVVEATFSNFHPDRVRRAIPDAWTIAEPAALVALRAEAAAVALRRIVGEEVAEDTATAVLPALQRAVDAGATSGRPLFAANRDVAVPADPVAALWQAATALREHRGDGHVALLAGHGLDGCAGHVLFAACTGVPGDLYLASRGWTAGDWAAATDALRRRGLLDADGAATDAGRELHESIERRTDELAAAAYAGLGQDGVGTVVDQLAVAARRVGESGEIRFPNPMGLPAEQDRPVADGATNALDASSRID